MTQSDVVSTPRSLTLAPDPVLVGQTISEFPATRDPLQPTAQSAKFRADTTREVFEMAEYLLSNGKPLPLSVVNVLQLLEDGTRPALTELTASHFDVAQAILPAKPIGISALNTAFNQSTASTFMLGPTIGVRRLTLASLSFAALFFAVSLSGRIDSANMAKTFLELSGTDLILKHLILISAAGLGATFGVLFNVWYDLAKRQFDPLSESAHWMRIGLGLVAGIMLSEIINTQPGMDLAFSAIVLALLGGFSAAFLHRTISRVLLKRAGVSLTSSDATDETHRAS